MLFFPCHFYLFYLVGLERRAAVFSASVALRTWFADTTALVCSLGTIYSAGDFRMSTWIPFLWALINVLFLILSSFSLQGGLL